MPKHCRAKTATDARKRLKGMVERKTQDPHERELYMEALETPFKLLAQGEEELKLLIKYLNNPKASKRETQTYLSNLSHCIGTAYYHIVGIMG